MTRREVRGCAEGRWERGLSFPARGRKAAGSAPAASPGTTVAARPARHSGRTQAEHVPASEGVFFLLSFLPVFFFTLSLGPGVCTSVSRGCSRGARGSQFLPSRAPPRASCLSGRAGALAKAARTFPVFPSARLG